MENEATIRIHDLAYGGQGVGRLDGMAVFVRDALPGEEVQVCMTEKKKNYAKGQLLRVTEASSARIVPVCPLAGTCPGCAYQHLAYQDELVWKQAQLRALLARVGGISDIPDHTPIAAPAELGYRNKVVLHVGSSGQLGYIGFDNQTVIDVPDCPLAVDPIRDAIATCRKETLPHLAAGDSVTFRWTQADGVLQWVNQAAPTQWLTEAVDGAIWRVPAGAFWQVNSLAIGVLLAEVSRRVADAAPRYLLDLYCGSGLFSLALAEHVENVLGVEWVGEAVKAARHNATERACANVAFTRGDAGGIYPDAQARVSASATMVVVDPPRSGLAENLRKALIQAERPQFILYISCAADTLARDCKVLCQEAYKIKDVQLVDLFPRTAHFETIVVLERT